MKRLIACLLALLLFGCAASAETVLVPVWQDVDSTDVLMERYESALGFSMAYDPAHFTLDTEGEDTLRFTDYANAFINFQSYMDLSLEELAEGLALQSKTEDCATDDAVLGGLLGDSIEATSVMYQETADDGAYQHSFFLVARDADTLVFECYYPLELDAAVSADFAAMMQTIELTTAAPQVTATPAANASQLVRCEICGEWFKAGNEFRNHVCIGYPSADDDMVQCEICGEWFHAGNEFRNHICASYPSEDNQVETYPSEDNQAETYPSEDNQIETYPSEDNQVETYPSEDN